VIPGVAMRPFEKKVGYLVLLLLAASMACQLTSPTPASWSGTPTAQAVSETNTVIAQTQQARLTEEVVDEVTITEYPTETIPATTPTPQPTIPINGPWLWHPAPEGDALHAYDVEAKKVLKISLPKPIYTGDLTQGLSPDGKTLVVRAGSPLNTDELALYQIALPSTEATKLTPLLSITLQRQIINEEETRASETFQAVTHPDGLAWSLDGRYLAFSAALRYEASNLYVVDTLNDRVTRLTGRYTQSATPFWAPDSNLLISQELGDYIPESGWHAQLVSGLRIPGFDQQQTLYIPGSGSQGEVFLGWINAYNFISYSQTAGGPVTIRQVNIQNLAVTTIFQDSFSRGIFDPISKSLAFTLNYENAAAMDMVGGVYLLKQGSPEYILVQAGNWTRLTWDPVGMYVAASAQGVLSFTPEGESVFLANEGNLRHSPHGNWMIAWGDGVSSAVGARLYQPNSDHPLQTLIDEPVNTVFWEPDSRSFFIHSKATLFHLAFPGLKLTEVETGFLEQTPLEMIWLE